MKKPIQAVLACFAFAAFSLVAQAQPALKIMVVDMAKLYDNYYKTLENNAKMKRDDDSAAEMVDKMNKEGNAMVEEYKTLSEQSNNPALTAEAKAKAQQDAAKKLAAIQQKQDEIQGFIQNTRQTLNQVFQNFKNMMLEEISVVVSDIGKRKGATIIIDKTGPTYFGISNIVYSDPSYEFTDEVLKELNKNAPAVPAGAAAAPAATAPKLAPSGPAAPASSAPASGGVVIPGMGK